MFVKPKAEFVCCNVRGAEDTPGFLLLCCCGFQQDVGMSFPHWLAQLQRAFPSQHLHSPFNQQLLKELPKVFADHYSPHLKINSQYRKKNPLKYKISRLIHILVCSFCFILHSLHYSSEVQTGAN